MKRLLFTFIVTSVMSLTCHAQICSRLHVKTNAQSTVGIATETSTNKMVGIIHDGSFGIISTTAVNGLSASSPLKFATAGQIALSNCKLKKFLRNY